MSQKSQSKYSRKELTTLVDKFLTKAPRNWGLEFKTAKQLYDEHGLEVWAYVRPEPMGSLLWFKTPEGKKCIAKAKRVQAEIKPEKKKLDFDEVSSYIRVTKPRKSLRDRLTE